MNTTGSKILKKFTCPTCNSGCGLSVEIEQNRVISVKPDKAHPLTKGYCCPKGLAWKDITNSEDRVTRPLKRVGATFQPLSWKQALHEIAVRLTEIRTKFSPQAIAYYMGTNSFHHYAHSLYVSAFMGGLGSDSMYNAGSVDNNNHFVAQQFLYGSPIVMPVPDLPNTDLFIIVGSNPAITHLSLASCPNANKAMRNLIARGGEIYVIDPRKNKTARRYANDADHYLPIIPGTDIFLLLSMVHIIFEENLADKPFLEAHCLQFNELKELVQEFTPQLAALVCHVPAEKIYSLTRKFAKTDRAVIYGRMGLSASTWSTLNAWVIEVLNIITGKLDRPGGKVFGMNIINVAKLGGIIGMGSYNTNQSRIGNYPEVMGAFPLGTLAKEILNGNIRALIVSAGNPALSAPNSNEFRAALNELELCIVLDFFINETAYSAADYILPVTTPLENSNFHAIYNLNYQLYPNIQYVEAPVSPDPWGPKPEWEILWSLIRLMRLPAFGNAMFNTLHKIYEAIYKQLDPSFLIRILLFLGQVMNRKFPHLSSTGITLKQLKKQKIILLGKNTYGVIDRYLQTKTKKIALLNRELGKQLEACKADFRDRIAKDEHCALHEDEFFVIGRRLLKTSNSFFHNVGALWPKKEEPKLWMNPQDAQRLKITDDAWVILKNGQGSVEVPVMITADIMPGVVSYPHGWGHNNPMLSFAREHPGANINILTNSTDLDKLCGMPIFNGDKVKLSRRE